MLGILWHPDKDVLQIKAVNKELLNTGTQGILSYPRKLDLSYTYPSLHRTEMQYTRYLETEH